MVLSSSKYYTHTLKMAIDVTHKLFKIVLDRKARNSKRLPQTRNMREETIRIKLMLTANLFNNKMRHIWHMILKAFFCSCFFSPLL